MKNDLVNDFRNVEGFEVKSPYTQYSDLKLASKNRDFNIGAANAEVMAITSGSANGILFLPVNSKEAQHRILPTEHPSNLAHGKNIVTVEFSPFDPTLFIGLAEDKSSAPPSVVIFGGRYDPNLLDNIAELNSKATAIFSYDMCHAKRPCEILFNPFVEDLVYSAGNSEITAYRIVENELDIIAQYTFEGASFISDIDVSDDGKFIAATYPVNTGSRTETYVVIYSADYETMKKADGEFIEPIASISVGSGQQSKVAMFTDGNIVVARLDSGKRNLTMVNYDESSKSFTLGSTVEVSGTSPFRITHLRWQNIFFVFGRGDMKVEMLCFEEGNIKSLGMYKSTTNISGILYFPITVINPQNYEIIRLMVAKGSSSLAKTEVASFSLPRSGSFESSTVYKPMPYNEPSLTFEEYMNHKGAIPIKTIHPVSDFGKLMQINKISGVGTKSVIKGMKPSKKFASSSKKLAPKTNHSPPKSEPVVNRFIAQAKPKEPEFSKPIEEVVGKPIESVVPPKRKTGVTTEAFKKTEDHITELTNRVEALEKEVSALKATIEVIQQSSGDMGFSDSNQ